MEVCYTASAFKEAVERIKEQGKRIALVPTMGYLHAGHLALMDAARTLADVVVLTVFVNPIQFGPNEDLATYPQNLDRDLELAKSRGVQLVFCPKPEEVYEPGHSTFVVESSASLGLCGASRPGHFKGVLTVCCKLFLLSRCDVAVFGQKDAQQVALVEKMVRELNMPLSIHRVETMRDVDGLAMSSRNAYLSEKERTIASTLYKALQRGRTLIEDEGMLDTASVVEQMRDVLAVHQEFRVDYLAVVNASSLEPLKHAVPGQTLIVAAVFLGTTRLIDNVLC